MEGQGPVQWRMGSQKNTTNESKPNHPDTWRPHRWVKTTIPREQSKQDTGHGDTTTQASSTPTTMASSNWNEISQNKTMAKTEQREDRAAAPLISTKQYEFCNSRYVRRRIPFPTSLTHPLTGETRRRQLSAIHHSRIPAWRSPYGCAKHATYS